MAASEEHLCRGSGETVCRLLSFHGAHYTSAFTDQPDLENLSHLHDPLEEGEVVQPHDQPARMGTDSHLAWRALDLMFPRENIDEDWSDWEGSEDDVDDGKVIDGDKETTYPGEKLVDDFCNYDDDDCHNGQVIDDNKETNCPGKNCPMSEEEAGRGWRKSYLQHIEHYMNQYEEILARGDESTPFPPYPMKVFPNVTLDCIRGDNCHHRYYKTHDTSTTLSTLGYHTPKDMLQFFDLRLSSSEPSYPISVYGIFAVRDDMDRRRNYVFNRPRDDAVMIEKQDSFVLPLCSPCRGIYVLDHALLDVDLWVKKEGDGSADKQILSAYVEIDIHSEFDYMLKGRIPGEDCNLDLKYMFLAESVEAVIQVYAKVDHPHYVRFTALSTLYNDQEIVLFDEKLCGNEKLIQHIVTVKSNEKLDVLLKVDQSQFQWTFQDDYFGAVSSPDDSIFEYGQFFVRVFFAPKNSQ